MLEIKTLGGLFFKINGEIITDVGSHKAEALLVYVAYENRPINRKFLATLLWPEGSQENASTSLRVALAVLRKSFEDYLEITREYVFLRSNTDWRFDVHELLECLESGRIGEALAIHTGDFLAGFHIMDSPSFEAWQRGIQSQIILKLSKVLQDVVDIAISTGDITYGLTYVNKWLKLDPINESAYQRCLLLHSLNHDPAAVKVLYKKCIGMLKNEYGISPSAETQSIYHRLVQGQDFHDFRIKTSNTHLPTFQTSFVGRKIELFQISKLLRDQKCRLLTLTGPGGVGKSRLAVECARLVADDFPGGIYFVSFDGCSDGDLIIPFIAKELEFSIDTIATPLEPEDQLIDYLRKRVVLLLLDGFDHLVSHAKLLARLLEAVPGVKILVTSREKLNLKCEWIYTLSGLPLPEEGDVPSLYENDSIQLFLARLAQLKTDFHPSMKDFSDIGDICKNIAGIPLGIELAAAWSGILTIEEIKNEVLETVDFLEVETQDLSKEHQSLRAVFQSSWHLLSPQQQKIFSQLAIFQGEFDFQVAQIVTGANLKNLSELVSKSLVMVRDQGRFSLHSLNQEYALEKLDAQRDARFGVENRYSQYYLDYLLQRQKKLMESEMLQARSELRRELTHILAAMIWICKHGERGLILDALNALLVFYAVHNNWFDGVNFFARLAEERKSHIGDSEYNSGFDPVVFSCKVHQAFLLSNLGRIDQSEDLSRSCLKPLQKSGLRRELSECLHNLGVNASFRGEYRKAQSLLEEAIQMGKESDHILWPTYLLWLGHVYFLLGEYEQGLLTLNRCHAIFESMGTFWGSAFALSKMGLASDGLGEHQQAIRFHQRALAVFEKVENQAGKGYCLSRMSISACHLGNFGLSKGYAEEAQKIFEAIGHHWGLSSALSCLGFACYGLGNEQKARQAFCTALRISNRDQMAPLSLYALTGLGLILLSAGQTNHAFSLLDYVKHHPKMAKAYFDHALCVLKDVDLSLLDSGQFSMTDTGKSASLEEMIEKILPLVCAQVDG